MTLTHITSSQNPNLKLFCFLIFYNVWTIICLTFSKYKVEEEKYLSTYASTNPTYFIVIIPFLKALLDIIGLKCQIYFNKIFTQCDYYKKKILSKCAD